MSKSFVAPIKGGIVLVFCLSGIVFSQSAIDKILNSPDVFENPPGAPLMIQTEGKTNVSRQPLILTGDTFIRTSVDGKFVIAIDRLEAAADRRQPDGIADDVFVFRPREPSPEHAGLWFKIARAMTLFSGATLVVFSPDEGVLLNVSVEKNDHQFKTTPALVHIVEGIELIHRHRGFELGIEELVEEIVSDAYQLAWSGGGGAAPRCESGGPGSVSCTKRCTGFGGVQGEECSTTCGAGYYACCYCSFLKAYCVCRQY